MLLGVAWPGQGLTMTWPGRVLEITALGVEPWWAPGINGVLLSLSDRKGGPSLWVCVVRVVDRNDFL